MFLFRYRLGIETVRRHVMAEIHRRRDRASPDDRERRHRRHRERESPQEQRERPRQRSRSPQRSRSHRKEERERRHDRADDSRRHRKSEEEEEEEGRRRGRRSGDDERESGGEERKRGRRRRDDERDQGEGGGRERGERRWEEKEEDKRRVRGVVKEEGTSNRRETQRPDVQEQRRQEEDISQYEYGGGKKASEDQEKKEDPDFGLSGKLTAETNTLRGVVINYREPPEARQPKTRWRLYVFKGDETLPTLYIHRQSAYLIGRDRRIVDLPIDHPSCSKQHAVLQYRLVDYEKEDGGKGRKVKPYIIDLESTNGVYVNNQRIEAARYVELKEMDMVKFGFSSREYILLHENSKGVKPEEEAQD